MANRTRWLIASIAMSVSTSHGRGDQLAPPQPYRLLAPGWEYVFVMLDPHPAEGAVRWTGSAVGVREPGRPYPRSGLYRNDGSADPLWTVDWYADEDRVAVAADGVHLVRLGYWVPSADGEAIRFLADGRLLRSYSYRELMGEPDRVPRSVSGLLWFRPVGRLDDLRKEYALKTEDGNRFVFDLRTGEVVSESRVARSPRVADLDWWPVVLLLGVVLVAWVVRHWRSRAAPDSSV